MNTQKHNLFLSIALMVAMSAIAGKNDTTYYAYCGDQKIPESVSIKKSKNTYLQQYFDRAGHLRMSGLLVDGLPEGEWVYYEDSLYLDNMYMLGAYPLISYMPYDDNADGGKVVGDFKDGDLSGSYTGFYKNGNKWFEKTMDRGMVVGVSKEWYSNGQLRTVRMSDACNMSTITDYYDYDYYDYDEDNSERIVDFYSEKGEHLLKNGSGKMYENYPNGNMQYYEEYKDSILHGISKNWDEEGLLTDSARYDKGMVVYQVSISRYDYDGEEIDVYVDDYENDLHMSKVYDGDWNLKSERYGDDYTDTLVIEYFDNGNMKSKRHYGYDDMENGKFEEYFENGELKSKGEYDDDGFKTGLWIRYWDNGKLAVKGTYLNDEKHDEWEVYNKNGELVKRELYFEGTLVETVDVKPGAGTIPSPK